MENGIQLVIEEILVLILVILTQFLILKENSFLVRLVQKTPIGVFLFFILDILALIFMKMVYYF